MSTQPKSFSKIFFDFIDDSEESLYEAHKDQEFLSFINLINRYPCLINDHHDNIIKMLKNIQHALEAPDTYSMFEEVDDDDIDHEAEYHEGCFKETLVSRLKKIIEKIEQQKKLHAQPA